jgi:hypothetical protein
MPDAINQNHAQSGLALLLSGIEQQQAQSTESDERPAKRHKPNGGPQPQ